MKTPTFREQYDKIVGAYLRNELKPWDNCACFIGNMLNGKDVWANGRDVEAGLYPLRYRVTGNKWCLDVAENCLLIEAGGFYSINEIVMLENNFLFGGKTLHTFRTGDQEENLYAAMESTLLMLKKIHESKGEIVDDYVFEKRALLSIE